MLVYLDICVIQRPLDDLSHPRVRLEAEAALLIIEMAEQGDSDLALSAAHEIENDQNPFASRKAHTARILALSSTRIATSDGVGSKAEEYVRAGIGQLDALHLASAVMASADFFCTVDRRFAKRAAEVDTNATAIVSPLHLVSTLDIP